MSRFSTQQIADQVNGELVGRGDLQICGVERLDLAQPGQLGFARDGRYARQWSTSNATAVLAFKESGIVPGADRAVIVVEDVDQALASVLAMFRTPVHRPDLGVHPNATIDASAELSPDTAVGPGCVVGSGSRVGRGTILHPNVVLGAAVTVGEHCELFAGVVIGDRCELADHVTIHPCTVVGADGFGYRPAPDGSGLVKIPQIGTVHIGSYVEIGANTCIDRGKFSATIIGDGTKIDNLCQIAHNCRIGRSCVLAAQVGLAGSVTVEDGVMLGGQAGVADHLTIGAGAKVGGQAGVTRDVPPGATWWGTPGQDMAAELRESVALRRLPGLIKKWRSQGTKNRL